MGFNLHYQVHVLTLLLWSNLCLKLVVGGGPDYLGVMDQSSVDCVNLYYSSVNQKPFFTKATSVY